MTRRKETSEDGKRRRTESKAKAAPYSVVAPLRPGADAPIFSATAPQSAKVDSMEGTRAAAVESHGPKGPGVAEQTALFIEKIEKRPDVQGILRRLAK